MILDDDAVAMHSWNDGVITKQPTCVENGIKKFTCNVCGSDYTETIEATGIHIYNEPIVEIVATCNSNGVKKISCKECDDYYTEEFSLESYNANQVYTMVKNSIGEIITYKGGSELALGTGIVYTTDGKIITNYHVIEGASSAKININGVEYSIKSILAYDKNIDLAVLQIYATGLTPLNICNKEHAVGKAVYAIGSSKGLTATFSQGIITYSNRVIDGVKYVQHDAAISSGNSGGPLINEYGELIGVNTMTIEDSQNLNFAISINELSKLKFGTPLTFTEFNNKESDVFLKMKNYIISKGKYSSEDNQYTLSFGVTSYPSQGFDVMTQACYSNSTKKITLSLLLVESSTYHFLQIHMDSLDSTYEWDYINGYNNFMSGNIYATTWTSGSMLKVSQNININTGDIYTAVRNVATDMVHILLLTVENDFAAISLKLSDLGFINY